MPKHVHLTNARARKVVRPDLSRPNETAEYLVTYCGRTFMDFAPDQTLYHYTTLQKLINIGEEENICPECLSSSDLALDLLGNV